MWESNVWVDGQKVDVTRQSLTTPQVYNLTSYMKPGQKQQIIIRIDNRKKHEISAKELAYTEDTQIKWKGILGEMYLSAYRHASNG